MTFCDWEVGETADSGVFYSLQYLVVYLPASAAPGVLLSVWAKWSLTESFHVSASDPARHALAHCHKHTHTDYAAVIYHCSNAYTLTHTRMLPTHTGLLHGPGR